MKIKTPKNAFLVCGLLGVMLAGQALGLTLRYNGSGDYNDLLPITGVNGWPTNGLPNSADTIRFNWGNNLVTLTNVAPNVSRFQMGVDESGQLVVQSGGKLTAVGGSANVVGNNTNWNNPGVLVIGQLTVFTNGVVNSAAALEVGYNANGILTIDGGTVNVTNHLWVGCGSGSPMTGVINITNGGVLNIQVFSGSSGMLGLGTINASTASTGKGFINVSAGSALNLYNISGSGASIFPGSVLNISGSGVVTILGDKRVAVTNYVNAGRITAYGGTGTINIDYNVANPGKTTLTAVGGYVAPTDVVWNPTNNPATSNLWSEGANWTGGYKPAGVTAVVFNQVGATPCTVNDSASADYVIMGTNGPGGTLIVTNNGVLSCGSANPTIIGYDSNALMQVENGATVSLSSQLHLGLYAGANGTLVMNGGTVSVAGAFDLGSQGGIGTAQIKGGTLNLSQWDDNTMLIQTGSILDITGTGVVVINGDHVNSVNGYILGNQITNSTSATSTLLVDYNIINSGRTTVYPSTLYLPPAQAVWNPAANPTTAGMWDETASWSIGSTSINMVPGSTTVVTFNVVDAIPCTISNAASAGYINMGPSSGPGGTLIVTNGGSLTTGTYNWSAVAYGSNATMIVENGGTVNFGYHLWVGFDPGSDGTFIMNGGTVSVGGMFGLGWNGGKGTAQINGGTLNLAQIHPTDSIKGASVLNLTGTGTVAITGNQLSVVSNYIASGKITANGGSGVAFSYNNVTGKTTLQVAPPRGSVTGVSASAGNMTLTYQTTPGHLYHIESTPSLSPASWTSVVGSVTNATGTSVTFTFPTSGNQLFYRTVSP